MSTQISAATILANVAANIAVAPFSTTTHVTAAQALAWLQQSVEALCALNKQKLGTDADFMQYAALTTVPGVNLTSLPLTFGELINLFWSKSDTEAYVLEQATYADVEPEGTHVRQWYSAPKFRLSGQTIEIFPCPDRAYTLGCWYLSAATLADASASFAGRLDWSRWLELDLMLKCLQRKRRWTDMQATQGLKNALEQNLFATSRKRNQAGPHRVTDVDNSQRGQWWRYGQ